MIFGGCFDITSKKDRLKELENIMNSPTFWDNQDKSNEVLDEIQYLKNTINSIDGLYTKINEMNSLLDDDEALILIEEELPSIEKETDELELLLLLSGPYDKNNAILEVHSGAGGTEACDWADMLYRMYQRYCDKHLFKYTVLDYQEGDEAGIKSASILVKGPFAYGYLKCEKGIHRLVRLSPFDSNHKRHTSFASIDVMPEIDNSVNIEINEEDLKIDVYRSSGKGGQGVNTTDSAVRITHLPTKIVVTCQNERSQLQNKEQAMKMLKAKLLVLELEKQENELKKIKGEQKNIEFGSQIRSYVMHPYSMVKDHRTEEETSNVQKVLDGDIDDFIIRKLKDDKDETK
jgi:peptide chain release factor 2